jgi:hypothetical protein
MAARPTGEGRRNTWQGDFKVPRSAPSLGKMRPREGVVWSGRRGGGARRAWTRRARWNARRRAPASVNSVYPCLTEFISKFLN